MTSRACPDCGVAPGVEHEDGCDVARCTRTGNQRLICGGHEGTVFEGMDCGRDVWTGAWPQDTASKAAENAMQLARDKYWKAEKEAAAEYKKAKLAALAEYRKAVATAGRRQRRANNMTADDGPEPVDSEELIRLLGWLDFMMRPPLDIRSSPQFRELSTKDQAEVERRLTVVDVREYLLDVVVSNTGAGNDVVLGALLAAVRELSVDDLITD
jgi:hypothetical protein